MITYKKSKIKKSCFDMVLQNMTRRSSRSALMIFLLSILSFTVFSSSMLLKSLELGITSTADKLGADIIIVPKGYVSELQNALFTGVPCTVYFDRDWLGKIQAVEGVGKTTHQLYLSTITDSDCCDKNLQIIAFDPKTDFVVQPWIKKTLGGPLSNYEIIVGNSLKYNPGDTAKYYGERFSVAAKLDKTGMGYDNTVFMNYETAYDLARKPVLRNYFSVGNRENLVSMIMVKIKEGYDAGTVAKKITERYGNDGISVYTSNDLMSGISDNLKKFSSYSWLLNGLLLISTAFALLSIFSITINERKREFGILRSLGAARKQLVILIVGEAEIISAVGCLIGCMAAWYTTYAFQNYIVNILKVPFLQPQFQSIAFLTGKCMLVTLITGFAASLYAAVRISFAETYALLRENEV